MLATKHDKLPLIAPALRRATGLCVSAADVDTDPLGTFAGEIQRRGSPWETAVAKARLGMEHAGSSIGLASEGSIGPDPAFPMVISDTELLVLVDDIRGIVIGEAETAFGIPAIGLDVDGADDSALDAAVLQRGGFPEHGVIVRPATGYEPIFKGIHDLSDLHRAINSCVRSTPGGRVRIESDLRAHHHPSRRIVIARAAERLAARAASLCPGCACPGWGVGERAPGAPCAECRFPTPLTDTEVFACGACGRRESLPSAWSSGVDPRHCPRCNP